MPAYTYKCKECEYQFDTFHSITENLNNCDKCGKLETLERLPQLLTSYSSQRKERSMAGERVEKFIEDSRRLLLDSKQELKNRDFK